MEDVPSESRSAHPSSDGHSAVPDTGERIPYADVSATIVNRADKAKVEKELPAMFGDKLI